METTDYNVMIDSQNNFDQNIEYILKHFVFFLKF